MPEGFDWSRPPFAKKVYRVRLLPVFLVTLVFTALTFAALHFALHAIYGLQWSSRDYLQLLIVPPAMAVVVTPWVNWLYRVDLTPDSVTTSNAYGIRQKMLIKDIDRAWRPWYAVGIFVIVQGEGHLFRLWVPLFLHEFPDFSAAVQQVTPDHHPLRAFLKEYVSRRR